MAKLIARAWLMVVGLMVLGLIAAAALQTPDSRAIASVIVGGIGFIVMTVWAINKVDPEFFTEV